MKPNRHSVRIRLSMLLVATLLLTPGFTPPRQGTTDQAGQTRPGPLLVVYADPSNRPAYVPPPARFNGNALQRIDAIQITVNYNPASCGANVTAWPANARTAFEYAASIWSWVLNGTRPIVVDACWRTDLAANVLGNAGASLYYQNFSGAPQSNTFYPIPLANQFANTDLNGSAVEIQARFNANQSWYRGLDGNVPLNQFDLVSVALHELGHGLGFAGAMTWDNGVAADGTECNGTAGIGCWGTAPFIYDRFTRNVTGTLISLGNNTAALGNALISDGVSFTGANAVAANGGTAPRLDAPNTWVGGSSYSHLREATFASGSINALMTPTFAAQEAIHHPGAIVLGMFRDMGWTMPDLTNTYVNRNYVGVEDGTVSRPFNTVIEGVGAVANGGTVWIQTGSYAGAVAALRPMTLRALNGTVVIGAP